MTGQNRDWWAKADIIAKVVGVLLIPIAAVVIGQWMEATRQGALEAQRQAEQVQREMERLARLSAQLTSENKRERLFALRVLKGYHTANNFPEEFIAPLVDMVYRDELDIAAEAYSLLTSMNVSLDANVTDERRLLGLLKPMMVQFTRTKRAFLDWDSCRETQIIKEGNKFNHDLLFRERKRFAKFNLNREAKSLIRHYGAWLTKYARIESSRGDLCKPVYVGPEGFPFPSKSEAALRTKFKELHSRLEGS